ncbi:hypothetical protein POM88_042938 [Heracleum sosnowskyi]|uniref:Ubiquitin fusion degradaton protein n=1 Tax=Heracleum sosnowskyi TaxID=360622 RepID=A0AAD8HJJ6_9APIA|nr:hypothetical protein POM88_042938 [Heracleum sosnowskyi]
MARRGSSSQPYYTSRPSSRGASSETYHKSRRSSRASSSETCHRTRPSSRDSYSMPASASASASAHEKKFKFRKTVKIMYNAIQEYLSQFVGCVQDPDFDVPDNRKKSSEVSKPSFNYKVHDHGRKTGDKSKRSFNSDLHNHHDKRVDKTGYESKPSFSYECYSLPHINRCQGEDGNKIIMPSKALDAVISLRDVIEYPVAVKIINPLVDKFTHCGVLEFSGEEEGNVYLPKWVMNCLLVQEGQLINLEYAALSKGTFLKIQPHSTKFLMNLSDRREAMERILKDFPCVTAGDTLKVTHENQSYFINIVQARPKKAVSLSEIDCEIEFTQSLDHEEPKKIKQNVEQVKDAPSLENDAVSRPLDKDDKKLVVSLRKYSSHVRGSDRNSSTGKNKQRQRAPKTSSRRHKDNADSFDV